MSPPSGQSRSGDRIDKLSFTAAGRELAGNAFRPGDREPSGAAILFLHGWESSQRSYLPRAEAAAEQLGATCLTFDLAGHGESPGTAASFTPREHLADAEAAYDVLAGMEAVDPLRIGICGASYGAYLAALLSGQRPARALLLRAPALYPDALLDLPASSHQTVFETPAEAVALRNLAAFAGPVLVVESEHDEVIPHRVVEAYLGAAEQAEHAVIPGAAHAMTDPNWNRTFIELLIEWARVL